VISNLSDVQKTNTWKNESAAKNIWRRLPLLAKDAKV